ncbi:hypothetical protein INS49_003953 [Diaporthe citri]|uniref:uncharacterized protein n=1 Tax=Diaporthe citri TaxID=83186 RepID=UPI001C813617|nr:uncharacterized protein INS49_003953 [Diaporthe citri]KAG6354872.1 hypothetical protein INS49_003953 [Diaporthe citri]
MEAFLAGMNVAQPKAVTCPYDSDDVDGQAEGVVAGPEVRPPEVGGKDIFVDAAEEDEEATLGVAGHDDMETIDIDSVVDLNNDAQQAVTLRSHIRTSATRQTYVQVPYEDYLRMTKAEQALKTMVGIAKEFSGTQRGISGSSTRDSAALHAEESELESFGEDGEGSDEPDTSKVALRSSKTPQEGGQKRRPWTLTERRRLQRMKDKGWDDERIGLALDRSSSAVSQQWRKQK